jgi:hypothetical protein
MPIAVRELKVGLMLLLIFAGGVVCGVLLDRKLAPPEPTSPAQPRAVFEGRDKQVLAEMTERMKLTPEQQKRVGEILGELQSGMKRNLQQSLKDRIALFDQSMRGIRTNLTPEQIPVLDKMIERAHRWQRQMQERAN